MERTHLNAFQMPSTFTRRSKYPTANSMWKYIEHCNREDPAWRSYVKRAVFIHSFAPSIEATPLLRILGYRMDIMLHDILYSNIQYAGDGYVFHNILLIRYTIIVVHVYCPRLYYWIESPANSYLNCMCVMFFEPIIKVIVHLNPILCSTTYNIMAVRTIQNFASMIVALSTCTQTERLLP
jgi:hypothetical protein